jgi:hypothetical protein
MFTRSPIKSQLEAEITSALDKLDGLEADSKEYGIIVERISELHKLKSAEGLKPPSMDTVLAVGANLLGIFWLSAVEREHVFAGKAIGFVMKPR